MTSPSRPGTGERAGPTWATCSPIIKISCRPIGSGAYSSAFLISRYLGILFLLVAQLGNAEAGVAVDNGENEAGVAQDGPGQIVQSLHAQAGGHIRAGGGPGYQGHEHGARVLQGTGQVLGRQAPLPVGVPEHLAGDQDGEVGVAG